MTALHFAACHGAACVVQILLDECETDMSVSTGGCLGFPIAFAAYFGLTEIVRVLLVRLERSAQPMVPNREQANLEEISKRVPDIRAMVKGCHAAALSGKKTASLKCSSDRANRTD
jgi:hypothetical protein